MKLFLSLNSLPEVAGLSPAEQKIVVGYSLKAAARGWPVRIASIGVYVAIFVGSLLAGAITRRGGHTWFRFVYGYGFMILCCALALLVLKLVVNNAALPFLREELGFCVRCGYNLRATPDRCPECGAAASNANAGER